MVSAYGRSYVGQIWLSLHHPLLPAAGRGMVFSYGSRLSRRVRSKIHHSPGERRDNEKET